MGGALVSAERGCSLSGDSARRSRGDAGSALLGRLIHFLTGAKDEPGEYICVVLEEPGQWWW